MDSFTRSKLRVYANLLVDLSSTSAIPDRQDLAFQNVIVGQMQACFTADPRASIPHKREVASSIEDLFEQAQFIERWLSEEDPPHRAPLAAMLDTYQKGVSLISPPGCMLNDDEDSLRALKTMMRVRVRETVRPEQDIDEWLAKVVCISDTSRSINPDIFLAAEVLDQDSGDLFDCGLELHQEFVEITKRVRDAGTDDLPSILRDIIQDIHRIARVCRDWMAVSDPSSGMWTSTYVPARQGLSSITDEEKLLLLGSHTAFHQAAIDGDLEKVQALLNQAPGDLNTPDTFGDTPLMLAAFHGHEAVVQLLSSQAECDVFACNSQGLTARAQAERIGHCDIARLFHREAQECLHDCPERHGLVAFITPDPRFVCDSCRSALPKGSGMWGCRHCNYDLCKACAVLTTPAGTGDEPSSSSSKLRTT